MTIHEKVEMLQSLRSGQAALLEALEGVAEDISRRGPGPGKWSLLECMEHVAVAEEYLFAQLASSKAVDRPVVNTGREAAIRRRGTDRTRRIDAPDVAVPRGRFASLKDARDHFVTTRDRTIDYVEQSHEDLRARIASHPLIGAVNCYELLLIIASHPHRHAEQIREIVKAVR